MINDKNPQEEFPDKLDRKSSGEESEDFGKLFEEFEASYSLSESGHVLMGRIVSKHGDYYLMDIGLKLEGRLPVSEVPLGLGLKNGSVLPLSQLRLRQEGLGPIVSLRQAVRRLQRRRLNELFKQDSCVEARIFRRRGESLFVGLFVEIVLKESEAQSIPPALWKFFPYPAEMPINELDPQGPGSIRRWIGKNIEAKILRLDTDGTAVVSRKRIVEERRETLRQEVLSSSKEGDIITARVKTVSPEGLIMDISGVEARLPQAEASWYPKTDLKRRFRPGDVFEVRIIKKDADNKRFIVSRRSVQPNPADELEKKFVPGCTVEGKVTKVLANGGCFVRLDLVRREAFVPASETLRDNPPKEGERIKAVVAKIDRQNIRIILSPRRYEQSQMPGMVDRYRAESQPLSLGQILNPTGSEENEDQHEDSEEPGA